MGTKIRVQVGGILKNVLKTTMFNRLNCERKLDIKDVMDSMKNFGVGSVHTMFIGDAEKRLKFLRKRGAVVDGYAEHIIDEMETGIYSTYHIMDVLKDVGRNPPKYSIEGHHELWIDMQLGGDWGVIKSAMKIYATFEDKKDLNYLKLLNLGFNINDVFDMSTVEELENA